MGAWGSGSFENDDASDWLADFCAAPNQQVITEALAAITDMDVTDYLEAPDCNVGIAAAEIVAAQKGAHNSDLTAETRDCIAKLGSGNDNVVSLALKALERMRNNSELKELWDESEASAQWYDSLADLEARLRQ